MNGLYTVLLLINSIDEMSLRNYLPPCVDYPTCLAQELITPRAGSGIGHPDVLAQELITPRVGSGVDHPHVLAQELITLMCWLRS